MMILLPLIPVDLFTDDKNFIYYVRQKSVLFH